MRRAISLLREGGQEFGAVIANVDWSIGFQLVELVGRNMGLPMIDFSLKSTVTCLDEDDQLFGTAIVKGACLGLVKQRLMDNLWLIWQLVLSHGGRNNAVTQRELASREAVDQPSRSEGGSRRGERRESDDLTLKRSSRLVWTDELNRKFIEAYNSLGDKEATPKKIQELMNVPYLTRENISSHLQKHRAALKKKAKEALKREGRNALVAKSSEENRGVLINEPVSMNLKDNAEQLPSNSTQNALSLPNTSSSGFRSSFGNTSMQPH
ncbi:hypothetical protein MLD38_000255 [Melastoma candidum]|uniref:Uncharacterized protein n=1 Tax=Melastoma candidum TaxID=119954 RepID=A0ACB9S9Y7_9MYRT|nr:hypothetical protein MLD38_000255 [Melastoma candidum]